MTINRSFASLLFIVGLCVGTLVIPTHSLLSSVDKTEVQVNGNPHAEGTCSIPHQDESSAQTSCEPKCQPHLLLQPHRIIRTQMMTTQSDTLIEITTKKVLSVPVPIYHFYQPARISPRQLRFQILLVSEIDFKGGLYELHVNDMAIASDSWFPGYYWSPIVCVGCTDYVHVGWKYTSLSDPASYFYALIVNVTEKKKEGVALSVGMLGEIVEDVILVGTRAPAWMVSALTSII